MTISVAVLVLAINLVLGAPLPFPQDVAVTTTTSTEAEFASLLPILQFFSTAVLADPTSTVSVFSSAGASTQTSQFVPPPTSTVAPSSQITSQVTIASTTSSSFSQQQSQTSVQNVQATSEAENVQAGINHGPVTFGELTTPSEGGTFNKFVENDGSNSTTGETATSTTPGVPPPPTGSHTTTSFAANTLPSYTFLTQTTAVHSIPSDAPAFRIHHHKHSSSSPSVPKASAASYNQAIAKPVEKRLFPSLFKDDEDFDRFDVPGLSKTNSGGKFSGQFSPPNVVPSSSSLFRPSGQSSGKNTQSNGPEESIENENNLESGFNNGNEGNGGGSENQGKEKGQSSKNSNEVKNNEGSNGRNPSSNGSNTENSVSEFNSNSNVPPHFPPGVPFG